MYREDLPTRNAPTGAQGREPLQETSGDSTPSIAGRLSNNIVAMLRTYAVLCKEEALLTFRSMVLGAIFLGVAAVISVYVVALVLATGILALSTVLRPWQAVLVGLLVAAMGMAVFAFLGVRRLKLQSMRTLIRQFREEMQWLRNTILGNS